MTESATMQKAQANKAALRKIFTLAQKELWNGKSVLPMFQEYREYICLVIKYEFGFLGAKYLGKFSDTEVQLAREVVLCKIRPYEVFNKYITERLGFRPADEAAVQAARLEFLKQLAKEFK